MKAVQAKVLETGGVQLSIYGETYDLIPEAAWEVSQALFKRRGDSGPVVLGGRQLILGPDTRLKAAEALRDALQQ